MPSQPTAIIDRTLRSLRILYAIFFLLIAFYIAIAEKTQHELIHMNRTFLTGLGCVAAILAGIVLYVQVKTIRPAFEALQTEPNDIEALSRWRSASFACYVIAEAIVLFGLCLRFLGGERAMALPFYGVGVLLMLFLFPRRP